MVCSQETFGVLSLGRRQVCQGTGPRNRGPIEEGCSNEKKALTHRYLPEADSRKALAPNRQGEELMKALIGGLMAFLLFLNSSSVGLCAQQPTDSVLRNLKDPNKKIRTEAA